ncbi:DNA repair protein RadA [Patescibacteria group bacterium]|nr:DNA repair protein RadA [Patescibacteria group bacterium]MBU1682416.1 DNA repair protein RadA [Patescibacteria group bacterium]MBU1935497.1 DNA repair protein RadA [Patescibacteria group bacterium]
MKLKQIYLCSKCGTESPRWSGQCMKCNSWNTLVEDVINIGKKEKAVKHIAIKPKIHLSDIEFKEKRLMTKMGEFDRVLGGGFMEDSVVLLVGDPGIGKSTLTLQICDRMASNKSVLYFSGEESPQQITSRAKRLKAKNPISIVNTNSLESILATIEAERPGFVVVDSVQVMGSEELPSQAGSISQVRYITEQLMQVSKSQRIPILLIGHVNKDGQLAGPQVLTHLVDTVLYLEGDRFHQFRLLRTTKNRFGAVDEVGVFAMEEQGLIEVENPSALFLEGRAKDPIGSCIVPVLEGTRTFLVEVQALTNYTQFGYPKRTASGFDINRLNIIIAVLNRYAKLKLDSSDVFVNVVGGLKLSEPAADLAVAMAIASSKLQNPLPSDLICIGEIGLSGEVRQVSQLKKRIKEADKLGFKEILSADKVKLVDEAVRKYFN